MDIVAIDFETANGNANSACQLAAVVVRDSKIVAEHSWLIRPPRLVFSPRNIAVHGIRPVDVTQSPQFEQVWTELSPIVDGQVLVAHNARFDIGVLAASLAAYDIACPRIEFTCTRLLARCVWPGRSGYGLKPLGEWLGIQFRHHDALEDARCCARIATRVEEMQEQQDLTALERKLRITRGVCCHSHITSPRRIGQRGGARQAVGEATRWDAADPRRRSAGVDPHAVLAAAQEQQPLAGKRIVLLGPLRGLDIRQSQELVQQLGGNCQATISPETHYVVACGMSLEVAGQTVCQALAMRESPAGENADGIRVLSERQFRALLPAGKASVRW